MAAYQAGDAAAFDELMLRHERRVWTFVKRFVKDASTAEDLLQEVFLRVVRSANEWRGEAQVSTWIFTIARNLCTDHARQALRLRAASLDAPARPVEGEESGPILADRIAASATGADSDALNNELRASIDRAVDALPADQKEVFLMREMMDMAFPEIAQALGATESTVKSRMRYALEKLRETLGAFYETRAMSAEGGA